MLTGIKLESYLYFHLLKQGINKKQVKDDTFLNARTEVLKVQKLR